VNIGELRAKNQIEMLWFREINAPMILEDAMMAIKNSEETKRNISTIRKDDEKTKN
jgi:hypothetical protein